MIGILDDFFIRISDLMINAFLKIIDFAIAFFSKFNNDIKVDEQHQHNEFSPNNIGDGSQRKKDVKNSKDDLNAMSLKSRIGNFLKNDSIFEDLEKRYSNNAVYYNNSSSNVVNVSDLSNQSKMSNLSNSSNSSNPTNSSNFSNQSNLSNLSIHSKGFKRSNNIFTSLNIENNDDYNSSDENEGSQKSFSNNIKEKAVLILLDNRLFKVNESEIPYLIQKLMLGFSLFIISLDLLIAYFTSLELALAFLISFILIAFLIIYYPKIKRQNDYSSFSKELPYALRQLATELRSGKSLFDSMASIIESDYGILSLEFSRVLEEIKYGESTEDAFLNLERRVDSQAFSRVVYEILTSLWVGANLSASLTIIADDVNFDIRMKLKEYSEKLNAFVMIYTFLAILAPVIILTILLAASVVIGDLVPGDLILILYSVFFSMIIVFLGFAIRKLEPKI